MFCLEIRFGNWEKSCFQICNCWKKQVFRNIFVSSCGEKKQEEALEIQRFLAAIDTTPSSGVCVEMKELQNARGEKFSSLTQRVQVFSLPGKLKEVEKQKLLKAVEYCSSTSSLKNIEKERNFVYSFFDEVLSKDLQRGKFVMLLQLRRDAVWSILPEYLSYGQRSSLEKKLFHLYVEYLERKENELRNSLL